MTLAYMIAQAIGLMAMGFDLWAATHKDDRKMVLFNTVACGTFALHFFLIGAYSGVVAELFNVARNTISRKWKYKSIGLVFAGVNAAMILTVDNVISALPYICGIIISISIYNFDGIMHNVTHT